MNYRRTSSATAGPWVYRPRSNVVFAATVGLLVIGWLWAAASVETQLLLDSLPWALAVAAIGYIAFVRPAVVVMAEGVTLINPIHTITVPWDALIHVSTRFAVTLHTPTGRYTAWAAPGPGRHIATVATAQEARRASRDGGRSGMLGIGDLPSAPSGIVALEIRKRWDELVRDEMVNAGEAANTPVLVTVQWPWVITTSALLLFGLVNSLT